MKRLSRFLTIIFFSSILFAFPQPVLADLPDINPEVKRVRPNERINRIVDFEDLTPSQAIPITDNYAGYSWDYDVDDMTGNGWGWHPFDVASSIPYDGTNYVLNGHGKNMLGITFPRPVFFNGAFFTKTSRRETIHVDNPSAYSAERIRIHYYNPRGQKIGVTDWFELCAFPRFLRLERQVGRIVIEHDGAYSYDNSNWGVPEARWFSMDHMLLNFHPNVKPDPFCEDENNNCQCDDTETEITGPPDSPVDFEDTPADQTALIDHANIAWDHDAIYGLAVYDAKSSDPYDGTNYVLNLHGKQLNGLSFGEPTYFNGAFFARCSRRWWVDRDLDDAYSADSLQLHYYSADGTPLGNSGWFVLDRYPTWFAAEVTCSRIVIEHDAVDGLDNSNYGVPSAKWFAVDHFLFNEPPGTEPPPYDEGGAGQPQSPVTFEDIDASQTQLVDHANILWDHPDVFGFSVYDAASSVPYDGDNFILNLHGIRELGFSFHEPTFFNGAFFTKCSRRWDIDRDLPNANSADSLLLHYYDENDQLIGTSPWIVLNRDPRWFAVEMTVSRVVVEHDGQNGWDNSHIGVPDAQWYSVDHMVFNEPAGYEPPPYHQGGSGQPLSPVTFDDTTAAQSQLTDFANIKWDHPDIFGYGIYDAASSIPYDGSNYILNLHGKRELGFSFHEPTFFNGAFFTKCSRRWDIDRDLPNANSADSLLLHYYDENDQLIGTSPWILLNRDPMWFAVEMTVSRVVVEHDGQNGWDNSSIGEPNAQWYSIDHMVFSEPAGYQPPPYCVDANHDGICDKSPTRIATKSGSGFALTQNYPNPFNPTTVIRFNLPANDRVQLVVYNILGQKIRVLVDGSLGAGPHEVEWYGDNELGQKVSAGVYFYRLVTSSAIMSKKMIMVK